jgi:hypothetical protein
MREIEEAIIHCSGSAFGNAALIDHWHRERGFDKIGYHAIILNGWLTEKLYDLRSDGLIETGRHIEEVGAHCYGKNTKSFAICLIGESGEFTEKQYKSLIMILKNHNIMKVGMHSDYNKAKPHCPGLDVSKLLVGMANG